MFYNTGHGWWPIKPPKSKPCKLDGHIQDLEYRKKGKNYINHDLQRNWHQFSTHLRIAREF
jgi:hypothetical protein